MLPAHQRLRDSATFRSTVRRGRRCAGPLLVLHLDSGRAQGTDPGAARAGVIVSRAVGGAVVRNTVKRRLRHLLRDRLDRLPAGSVAVVRALPASGAASYAELGAELDRVLERCTPRDPS